MTLIEAVTGRVVAVAEQRDPSAAQRLGVIQETCQQRRSHPCASGRRVDHHVLDDGDLCSQSGTHHHLQSGHPDQRRVPFGHDHHGVWVRSQQRLDTGALRGWVGFELRFLIEQQTEEANYTICVGRSGEADLDYIKRLGHSDSTLPSHWRVSSVPSVDLPAEATRRIAQDNIAWLTTVTDAGAPAPNPVRFVFEDDSLVVFAEPTSRKVHNIRHRRRVCLHFNSDPHGGDIVIINGVADVAADRAPSQLPGYLTKYSNQITEVLGLTMDAYDATYSSMIRIEPSRVRLTPG